MIFVKKHIYLNSSDGHTILLIERMKIAALNTLFDTIEKITATQQVAQRLKQAILDGTLPQGSRLPSERSLAAQLGVSRPVLREAIVMLSSYGLISSRQGEGNFIVDNFPGSVLSFMGFDSKLSSANYQYCMDCRELIETGVVPNVIRYTTPQDISALREINQIFKAEADRQAYVDSEIEFHRTFVSLARNPLMLELYSIVLKFVQASASYLLTAAEIRIEAYEAHKRIIRAVVDRDKEECRKAVRDHLATSGGNLGKYFQNNPES